MTSTDIPTISNEAQNRCIARIVTILRRYGAIDLTRQQVVVQVAFAGPEAEGAETDGDAGHGTRKDAIETLSVKPMQVEEIEYAGEGSFALRVTEAPDGVRTGRLTKKAAAALKAQTEQRIVLRRDGAEQFPRIAPEELDRIREAVEAFDRN